MTSAIEGLERFFGFHSFRPAQREIVEELLGGRDVLAVMPTGSGKSLCYQLPALLREGVTLVVSPLIALMKDQVDQLRARGIVSAAAVHSGLKPGEAGAHLLSARQGRLRLLYVAPERFGSGSFLSAVQEMRIGMFVVDEAHCVSAWGHDFRPDYLRLGEFVRQVRPAPLLALTATATSRVREEIATRLGMLDPHTILHSFDRPNLSFEVIRTGEQRKMEIVERHCREAQGSAIVYVARRADAEDVARVLATRGMLAVPYHAKMDSGARHRNQELFLSGKAQVIVATMAFGMGIDKPDVRLVMHYQHPGSLEAYYQEAGRAGRDGLPARCVALYSRKDTAIQEWFIDNRYPDERQVREVHSLLARGEYEESLTELMPGLTQEKRNVALSVLAASKVFEPGAGAQAARARLDFSAMRLREKGDRERLDAMIAYLTLPGCRRRRMLEYFGEDRFAGAGCGNCDGCTRKERQPPPLFEPAAIRSRDSRPQVEEALRELASSPLPGRLSPSAIGQLLIGSATKAVRRRGLETHPLFGRLRGVSRKEVVRVLGDLVSAGVISAELAKPKPAARPIEAGQVPRKIGLAILELLACEPEGLPRSGVANILRGAAQSDIVKARGQGAFPRFAAFPGTDYDALVTYVDWMTAKGYCELAKRGRVRITLAGKQALGRSGGGEG